MKYLICCIVAIALCPQIQAQEINSPATTWKSAEKWIDEAKTETQGVEVKRDSFHRAVIKAVNSQVKQRKLTRAKAFVIKARMLTPAFRKELKSTFLTQMFLSKEDPDAVEAWWPRTEDGRIDTASIDWDQLVSQIEKWMNIILELIEFLNSQFA